LARLLNWLFEVFFCMNVCRSRTGVRDVLPRFPVRRSELDRFKLGKKWYYQVAGLQKGEALFCLDVACGAKPFPKADVLCDLCLKPVPDRRMKALATAGKPFVLCNCGHLPFRDGAFDFVTSYYLLEHVDDPGALFLELKRVSRHGFVQCPSWFNELVYGEKVHKWTVLERGGRLYVKPLRRNGRLRLGFVFHRLYQSCRWQILHAVLDELFHVFSVQYAF
jgi:SAM-dependent methyltransferase